MPIPIPVTGLAANDPVPGSYLEINFAQGPASSGNATYGVLFLGNKTTAGAATNDTVVYGGPTSAIPLQTTQDAINLFGQGSELYRQIKRFLAVNTSTPIYAIAVSPSAGAAATGVVTFTTTATGNGAVRVWLGDDFTDVPITSGDTPTAIATSAVVAVNARADWAATASNSLGVLTLTSKNLGPRGNWLRFAAVITPTNVGTTSNAAAPAFFTGGTTADSNVTALATILASRYYYIVSAAEDATQLGALASQVNTQSLPITGIRQRVFAASVDTSSNVTTIATGINGARVELTWLQSAELTPAELAANHAAIVSLEEAPQAFRCNFDGYGNDAKSQINWKVPAPRSGTVPTRATIKAALNNGISPIGVNTNGTTYLVSRITTRSLTGAVADYRIRDAHKVTVCDRYADDLAAKLALQFSGKKIADDPLPGSRPIGNDVVTPRVLKAAINKLTSDYGDAYLVQNADAVIAATIVQRETSPTTRMSVRIPLQTIDVAHQYGIEIDQLA